MKTVKSNMTRAIAALLMMLSLTGVTAAVAPSIASAATTCTGSAVTPFKDVNYAYGRVNVSCSTTQARIWVYATVGYYANGSWHWKTARTGNAYNARSASLTNYLACPGGTHSWRTFVEWQTDDGLTHSMYSPTVTLAC